MIRQKHSGGYIILLFGFLLAQGCSRDPSPIGSDLLDLPFVDSLTVYADSSSNYRLPISGNSAVLLVGRYGEVQAFTLLQFPVPGLPSGVDTSHVVSASLRLIPQYWFLDSTGTLAFTIHKITRSWSEFDVTFDSTGGLYDTTTSFGSVSRQMSPRDTITTQIDTVLVREWIRAGQTYGIILRPDTAVSTVVFGFGVFQAGSGADRRPQLIIRYRRPDTTGVIDSLVYRTVQETFVASAPLPPVDSQFVYLQAGVADRGVLHFDVAAVPRNASVIKATLAFVRDAERSIRNELSQDSVSIHLISDTRTPPSLSFSITAQPDSADSASIFRANISNIVQQWVIGRPNYGIALRAFGEFNSIDRFVFHAASADSAVRPKLKIVYSIIR